MLRTKTTSTASYGTESHFLLAAERANLKTEIIDGAAGFASKLRSFALALYITDLRALDIRAEVMSKTQAPQERFRETRPSRTISKTTKEMSSQTREMRKRTTTWNSM